MANFFRKSKKMEVYSFADGKVKDLVLVPDQVFSQGHVGRGIAVVPTDSLITSPVDAKVAMIFPTRHALGLVCSNGVEIMLHIGIDTVELKGEGFEVLVKEGQQVRVGQSLLNVDFDYISSKGLPTDCLCIMTSPLSDGVIEYTQSNDDEVVKGETVLFRFKQ